MAKKDYIKPVVRNVRMFSEHHLVIGTNTTKESKRMFSRETPDSYAWDDEEEEIEDSMWK